ncbi:hypothetical protein BH23PAT2_BH23PAT2_07620 [soil metagenome]
MENYKKLCRELIEDEIKYRKNYDKKLTTKEILTDIQDNGTENIFGNMDGSRTCSTYEAQQFIDKSGAIWDEEILDLFDGISDDYFTETLKRGAETLDVVICELVSYEVISEMIEGGTK